jgi:hypothetical protein
MSEESEIFDFGPARAKWASKLDGSKAARKARHVALTSIDRRALRVTGGTAQLNFRCREDLKARVTEAASQEGVSIAEWMERVLEAALPAPETTSGEDP